jgi:hypothetical protein
VLGRVERDTSKELYRVRVGVGEMESRNGQFCSFAFAEVRDFSLSILSGIWYGTQLPFLHWL